MAPVRRVVLSLCLLLFLVAPVSVSAQTDEPRVDVITLSGPLDGEAVTFAIDTIAEVAAMNTEVVVVQLDSPAVVAEEEDFERLLDVVEAPPVPLAVWVGPAPARAFGGALDLVAAAPLSLAAPGAEIGLAEPTIAADRSDTDTALPPELADAVLEVTSPVDGVVDETIPTIRQVVESLDGATFDLEDGPRQVSTLTTLEVEGEEQVTTVSTVFHEPGYWSAFLRLAVSPEAAFFFLVAGLTVAAFEFYAIGPGIAAGVAAVSLFLASSGIASLPLRWWAMALVGVGWAIMTASYQLGSVAALSTIGAIALGVGGLWFVDGAPQLQMNPLVTLVIVAGVVAFYVVAMPTVARSRFSTRTIGRAHLVGKEGTATVDFEPDGEVDVDGARWQATAHREAGITAADRIRVVEVSGTVLEVEPVPTDP